MSHTKSAGEEFYKMIRHLDQGAFRLETLPQYLVDAEREEFAAFRAGQPLPPPRTGVLKEWDDIIRANRIAGKSMQRVHVLPEVLTPYLRYEIEWAYLYTATAGEEILLLPPAAPEAVRALARNDFWILDDCIAFFIHYDQDGSFLGMDKSDALVTVRECIQVRHAVLSHSITLNEYLASIRNA